MNTLLLLRTVWAQLWRYKLKTLLMVLGVGVGVVATATIQTLADSARGGFLAYVQRAFPTDTIVVSGNAFLGGGLGAEALTLPDLAAIRAAIPDIVAWDPAVQAGLRDIKHEGTVVSASLFGHSENAERVRRRGVQAGAFFSRADVESRSRVVLLGPTTAERLFGDVTPVGMELFIDNIPFKIVGVLESVGVDPHGADLDQAIWIPFTTAMEDVLGIDFVSQASFAVEDTTRLEAIADRIAGVMRERHGIQAGYNDDFDVTTPTFVRESLDQSFVRMDVLAMSITATVVALATAIVFSVMHISIKQRTIEIGLRKALGARPRDLRLQIVVEVLVVSALACVLGIVCAWIAMLIAAPILDEGFGMAGLALSGPMITLSILAAAGSSLLGGLLPALRAARIDASEALR
jgi:putative ABC transport system permease protein